MTIRNVDDILKRRLRMRAAERGHSMEEEARAILREALDPRPMEPMNLYDRIRARLGPDGGVDLEIPPREPAPEPRFPPK